MPRAELKLVGYDYVRARIMNVAPIDHAIRKFGYHTRRHSALGMSPAKAGEKATKEYKPQMLTSEEMRMAFGVRAIRKITQSGIQIKNTQYPNSNSISLLFQAGVEEVEILRWWGDIGAISVRANKGPWSLVTAADPMWIGKTETDLDIWLAERRLEDANELAARTKFINGAYEEAFRLKRLADLIILPRTLEELERDTARFSHHPDTAESRREFGEYRDILADHDDEDYAPGKSNLPSQETESTASILDADLME